jgi:DNA adenine methylase
MTITNKASTTITQAKPFLKWAGGKGGVLPQLSQYYPSELNNYFEPFLGGGAVFFSLNFNGKSHINDINSCLMRTFIKIRDNVDEVIDTLCELEEEYKQYNQEDKKKFYYQKRYEFNHSTEGLTKSILLIFLNKTCYNGLYRENRSGCFNVPFGQITNPKICHPENLRNASRKLQNAEITSTDYREATKKAEKGDFVYFDPPYYPLNATSNFTSYSKDDFDASDQKELAKLYSELDGRGCKVMLSNSDTKFIKELYSGFKQERVQVPRAINAKASGRSKLDELVILNYNTK